MENPVDSWVYRSEVLEESQGQKYRFSRNINVEWKSEGSMGQLEAWRDETQADPSGCCPSEGASQEETPGPTQQKPQWVRGFPSWLELLELSESPGCTQPDKSSWWLVGKSAAQGGDAHMETSPLQLAPSPVCSPTPTSSTLLCLRAFSLPFPVPSLSQLSPFYLVLSPSLPLGPLEGSNS